MTDRHIGIRLRAEMAAEGGRETVAPIARCLPAYYDKFCVCRLINVCCTRARETTLPVIRKLSATGVMSATSLARERARRGPATRALFLYYTTHIVRSNERRVYARFSARAREYRRVYIVKCAAGRRDKRMNECAE